MLEITLFRGYLLCTLASGIGFCAASILLSVGFGALHYFHKGSAGVDGNMTYGPLTNGTFGTYSYNVRNWLVAAGGLQYGYDPGGNRTSVTNGTNVGVFEHCHFLQ